MTITGGIFGLLLDLDGAGGVTAVFFAVLAEGCGEAWVKAGKQQIRQDKATERRKQVMAAYCWD